MMKMIKPGMLCFFLLILPMLPGAPPCHASDLTVLVLKSEGNYPVEDLLAGFKSEMQQNHFTIRLATLENELDKENLSDRVAAVKPDVLLCIGSKALEKAAALKRPPKIYAMVTMENAKTWQGRTDISGVTLDIAPTQQFRIMRQALPDSKRIGVLYHPEQNRKMIEDAKKAAAAAGFSLVAQPVDNVRDIPMALQKIENDIDILWAIYDQTAYSPETTRYILLQSLRKKIPMVGLSPYFAKAGALLAIYGDYTDMGRQMALLAVAVIRKAEPAQQMSRPRVIKTAVNEKVGRLLNVRISAAFLKTVDQTY